MKDIVTQVERLVQVAKEGAPQRIRRSKRRRIRYWKAGSFPVITRLPRPVISLAAVLEEATITTMEFGAMTNHAVLYLLREMEMTQSYRELGFQSLREWAYTRLAHAENKENLSRLCTAVLLLIAPLDAEPVITSDGEKVNGLALLAQAKPSSMIKVAGMFSQSTDSEKALLVDGLLTMGSNARAIKESAGWENPLGKAPIVYRELAERNEKNEPMVDIHIRATYAQSKVIERQLSWITEPQFTPLEAGNESNEWTSGTEEEWRRRL